MKTATCGIYCLLIAALMPFALFAQQADDKKELKNEISFSFNYQSTLHYFGRTDSLQSSGLFPMLGLQSKTGLYAQGNFIFIQNPITPTSYTGTILEGGYRFPSSEHFSGNVFYSQFLYKPGSVLVQSALHSQTGINLSYPNKILNINGGADLKFSDKTDFGTTLSIDHLFLFHTDNSSSAFAINPSISAYLGTQNFSNSYLQSKNVLGIPISQQVTEQVTQFNILAYEFSAPVVMVIGKCNASLTPSYVLPQNLITIVGRPDLSERGSSIFYLTASIGIRL